MASDSPRQPNSIYVTATFLLGLSCATLVCLALFLLMVVGASPGFSGLSSPTDGILVLLTLIYLLVNGAVLIVLFRQLQATQQSNYLSLRAGIAVSQIDTSRSAQTRSNLSRSTRTMPGSCPRHASKAHPESASRECHLSGRRLLIGFLTSSSPC